MVHVCTPSGLHAEIGIQAAQAGKHVLVEKPIDVTLAEADRLIQACRQVGVTLGVVAQHRFDPGFRQLQTAVRKAAVLQFRNGAIGTILGSTAIFPGLAERLEISGSDGTAIVEDGDLIYMATREALGDVGSHGKPWDSGSISHVAKETTSHAPPYGGRHTDQINDFINAVVQGRPLAITASDGRAALALVLAIYRSAATHCEVVLDDA